MHKVSRVIQFVLGYPRCPGVLYLHTVPGLIKMVRKSFILFYMINYHKIYTFLVCTLFYHSRRCISYNLYGIFPVLSMSQCHPETILSTIFLTTTHAMHFYYD